MEDKYVKTAQEILECMGGKDNIASAAHCATRLRLVLKNESLINKDGLDDIEMLTMADNFRLFWEQVLLIKFMLNLLKWLISLK